MVYLHPTGSYELYFSKPLFRSNNSLLLGFVDEVFVSFHSDHFMNLLIEYTMNKRLCVRNIFKEPR